MSRHIVDHTVETNISTLLQFQKLISGPNDDKRSLKASVPYQI